MKKLQIVLAHILAGLGVFVLVSGVVCVFVVCFCTLPINVRDIVVVTGCTALVVGSS